jgi:hypothetical protein
VEDSEISEYLGLRRRSSKKAKLILTIGIFLVALSISFSFLASNGYYEKKELSGNVNLMKNQTFEIKLFEDSYFSYSYVYNGSIKLNVTKPLLLILDNSYYNIENSSEINLKNLHSSPLIQSLDNDTRVFYKIDYTLNVKPYYFLAIPSLFILIIGSVFSFMGLYQYLLTKKSKSMNYG